MRISWDAHLNKVFGVRLGVDVGSKRTEMVRWTWVDIYIIKIHINFNMYQYYKLTKVVY